MALLWRLLGAVALVAAGAAPSELSVAWVMEILRVDHDQIDALLATGGLTHTEHGRLRITAS